MTSNDHNHTTFSIFTLRHENDCGSSRLFFHSVKFKVKWVKLKGKLQNILFLSNYQMFSPLISCFESLEQKVKIPCDSLITSYRTITVIFTTSSQIKSLKRRFFFSMFSGRFNYLRILNKFEDFGRMMNV